jgi:hypothetical protein
MSPKIICERKRKDDCGSIAENKEDAISKTGFFSHFEYYIIARDLGRVS